jgi:hypothetical protein
MACLYLGAKEEGSFMVETPERTSADAKTSAAETTPGHLQWRRRQDILRGDDAKKPAA